MTWLEHAACRGLPLDLFVSVGDGDLVDDEQWEPPPEVRAVCDPCPVREACLDWACSFDAWGYWAATSRHQRRQLNRPRRRLACPVCGSDATAVADAHQLCLLCGVSWRIGRERDRRPG